jgi:hypothetical protein
MSSGRDDFDALLWVAEGWSDEPLPELGVVTNPADDPEKAREEAEAAMAAMRASAHVNAAREDWDRCRARMLGVHGPNVIPYPAYWGAGGAHHPGLYGRYVVVDLDENNRHAIDFQRERFAEAHPDAELPPRPHLGWGVCRQGFGLQDFPTGLDQAEAERLAKMLNASTPVGVIEDPDHARKRFLEARKTLTRVGSF